MNYSFGLLLSQQKRCLYRAKRTFNHKNSIWLGIKCTPHTSSMMMFVCASACIFVWPSVCSSILFVFNDVILSWLKPILYHNWCEWISKIWSMHTQFERNKMSIRVHNPGFRQFTGFTVYSGYTNCVCVCVCVAYARRNAKRLLYQQRIAYSQHPNSIKLPASSALPRLTLFKCEFKRFESKCHRHPYIVHIHLVCFDTVSN